MAELTTFAAQPESRPGRVPGGVGAPGRAGAPGGVGAPGGARVAAARRLPGPRAMLVAQVRYQSMLLIRTPRALVGGVILPALLLIVTHIGKGPVSPATLAGLTVLGVTITAWSTNGITLVAARESGVLKRWRATPLPPWCYFVARIIATVVVSTLAGVVTLAIGILLYHTHLTAAGVLGALLTLVLGSLAWASAAIAITGIIPNVATAWPVLMVTYLPVILVSGGFGGLSGEPHWLTTLASYFPAEPMINGTTRALQYTAGRGLVSAHDIAVLACWTVAGLLASRLLFRWQPSRPTSRGRSRSRASGSR
jgi:ABC-2 type transport system permease protein